MSSQHSTTFFKVAAVAVAASALVALWAILIPLPADHTPPRIGKPSDLKVSLSSPLGTRVHFPPPQVTDDRDPSPRVVFDPPSGSLFPPGTSQVSIRATDAAGNTASERFAVTVAEALALPFTARLKSGAAALAALSADSQPELKHGIPFEVVAEIRNDSEEPLHLDLVQLELTDRCRPDRNAETESSLVR